MHIELGHNALLHLNRCFVETNSPSCKNFLNTFIDSRLPRGYKLRAIFHGKYIEMSSRKALNVQIALRELERAGFKPKIVKWKDNPLLKKAMNKGVEQKFSNSIG